MQYRIPPIIIGLILLSGCALVEVKQDQYKRDVGNVPQKQEISFASKQAASAGATLNSMVAGKVYYQGTKPLSDDAKVLYDMSYRFLGMLGVNASFDVSDPEAVKKVFEEADKAVSEKNQKIAKLEEDVAKYNHDLATKEKWVKDKEAESGKWRWRFGAILYGLIAAFIVIMVILFAIQSFTGIPFFTGFIKTFLIPGAKGGLSTIFKTAKQTAEGIERIKGKIDSEIETLKGENKGYEASALKRAREILAQELATSQDADVKDYIKGTMGVNK